MNDLSPKQIKSINLLAQGISSKDVAKELSIAAQTLSEWKKSPIYMAALNNFKMELLESARSALQHAPSIAVMTLVELMENSKSDETRRKAALDILRLTGFEPGMHETYAWGIGPRTTTKMKHELNGTLDLHNFLS